MKKIIWIKPNFSNEVGEYLENDYTKKFLNKYGLSFKTEKEVLDFLKNGKLVEVTRKQLENSENLELVDEVTDWKDLEYQESYKKMEQSLKAGEITLPAPIFLDLGKTYYAFAGNRRTNLAFNNKVPLKIWLVKLPIDKKQIVAKVMQKIALPNFKTLKDNKTNISPEEKKEAIKAGAVWHHGPNGEETCAIWKSKVKDKTYYVCHTHRTYGCSNTLKGAIKKYKDYVKASA